MSRLRSRSQRRWGTPALHSYAHTCEAYFNNYPLPLLMARRVIRSSPQRKRGVGFTLNTGIIIHNYRIIMNKAFFCSTFLYQLIYLPIYTAAYPSTHLSLYVYLFFYLLFCMSPYLSIYLPICSFLCLSIVVLILLDRQALPPGRGTYRGWTSLFSRR